MKRALLPILLFCATAACAQTAGQILELPKNGTGVQRTRMVMTGAESNKMFAAMKIAPGIYNEEGKLMDSLEAIRLKKTYEYGISLVSVDTNKNYRRVLKKFNLQAMAQSDAETKKFLAPKNPALQEGMILDLKPFRSLIPADKVAGKGIVLVFWYPGFAGMKDGFAENNEVISNYIGKGNFEVYAITRYPYDQATMALRTTPISNAHQLFDAGDLMDIYSPNNVPMIVVTDKEHKITYSVVNNAGMTPRILNSLLKNM